MLAGSTPVPDRSEIEAFLSDPATVERVAKAWEDMEVGRVAEAVDRKPAFDFAAAKRFFESLFSESDRAIPVLAWAFIEHWMGRRLEEEVNPKIPGGVKSLKSPGGLLSTSGSMIQLAHVVRWISDQTAADLNILRKIRNLFAHDLAASFDDARVASRLDNHRGLAGMWEAATGYRIEGSKAKWVGFPTTDANPAQSSAEPKAKVGSLVVTGSNRVRFVFAAAVSTGRVVTELSVGPPAQHAGVPVGLYMTHSDRWPPWLRELRDQLPRLLMDLMTVERLHVVQIDDQGRAIVEPTRSTDSPRTP